MKPKSNKTNLNRDKSWTPPYATEALCDFLTAQGNDLSELRLWEPACGNHDMARVLLNHFGTVFTTDLETGYDFLGQHEYDHRFQMDTDQVDCIITNPPYTAKLKYAFIDRCVEIGKPFALLMPVETISAAKAQRAFSKIGGISTLHFDVRVDFKQEGTTWLESTAQFPTMWFIHGFGLEPDKKYFYSIAKQKADFKKALREEAKL